MKSHTKPNYPTLDSMQKAYDLLQVQMQNEPCFSEESPTMKFYIALGAIYEAGKAEALQHVHHKQGGSWLREKRIALKYSIPELSEVSGISARHLQRYEDNQAVPSDSNLVRLAAALNTDVATLCAMVF